MLKQLLKQRDETIQQRDETIQQRDETIQQRDETIRQQEETIQQQEETIQQQSLKRVKTRFRFYLDTSMSIPHYPKNHGNAEVIPVSLDEVRTRVIDTVPDPIVEFDRHYTVQYEDGDEEDCSEDEIDQLVSHNYSGPPGHEGGCGAIQREAGSRVDKRPLRRRRSMMPPKYPVGTKVQKVRSHVVAVA